MIFDVMIHSEARSQNVLYIYVINKECKVTWNQTGVTTWARYTRLNAGSYKVISATSNPEFRKINNPFYGHVDTLCILRIK
jgi:hypothetical protein